MVTTVPGGASWQPKALPVALLETYFQAPAKFIAPAVFVRGGVVVKTQWKKFPS